MTGRVDKYISILLFSFGLCSYFPELDHYQLDNGINVIISPNYDVKYANISFLLNHGDIDQDTDSRIQETYLRIFQMFNMPSTSRKAKEIINDFNGLGISGKVFDANTSAAYTILSDNFLPSDLETILILTKEVLTETKNKKDKPVIVQKISNIFTNGFVTWAADLTTDNYMISRMHARSMLYDIPIIKFDYDSYSIRPERRFQSWVRDMLGPKNITVMVSGNINISHTKILLEEIYGTIDSTKYNAVELRSYIPVDNYNIRYIKHSRFLTDRGSNKIYLGYGGIAPAYGTDDYYPYMLAYKYIFNNSNLLGKYINKDDNADYEYVDSPRFPYVYFGITLDSVIADSVFLGISDQFKTILENGFSATDLVEANELFVHDAYDDYNNPSAFPFRLLKSFNNGHDIKKIKDEVDHFQSVDLNDLNRVCRKYFNLNDFSIVLMGDPSNEFEFLNNYDSIDYVDRYGNILDLKTKE